MNYIYKITCFANGRMYIGKRKWAGDPYDDDYFGSSGNPAFYEDLETYPKEVYWEKEILEEVESTDPKVLAERETYHVGKYYDRNKVCYNINPMNGKPFFQTEEQNREAGRKGGNSNKENHTGFCGRSPEKMSEDAKKVNEIQKQNHTGRYDSELQSELGKRGAAKAKELGVGAFFDKEIQSKAGKKGAAVNQENKTGFFSSETQSENGKRSVESKRKSGAMAAGSDMQKKATATRNIRYNYYLEGTDTLVYTGRHCDALRMMNQRNQVWDEKEEVSEEMFEYLKTNKEWFEINRYWYHPSASTPMTNGVKIIKCQMVKKLIKNGKSTWEEWTLTEFNS